MCIFATWSKGRSISESRSRRRNAREGSPGRNGGIQYAVCSSSIRRLANATCIARSFMTANMAFQFFAPMVRPGRQFNYFDPLRTLGPSGTQVADAAAGRSTRQRSDHATRTYSFASAADRPARTATPHSAPRRKPGGGRSTCRRVAFQRERASSQRRIRYDRSAAARAGIRSADNEVFGWDKIDMRS